MESEGRLFITRNDQSVSRDQRLNRNLALEALMIVLGVVLLLIGVVTGIGLLWAAGVVVLLVGLALWLLGSTGRNRRPKPLLLARTLQ
jgi:Flp pilus assembly protein TadB